MDLDVRYRESMSLPLTTGAIVVALVAAACGEDGPTADCTPPVPTYAMVEAFRISCNGCHASTLQGAARFGAPPGIDFDIYESAAEHAEHAAEEVFAGRMPPTAELVDADEQTLYRWALCGTPR